MRQRAIDGWPDHWYNRDGYIFCPARGCTNLFHNGNIRFIGRHWDDHRPGYPSYNDHGILLAICRQNDCVYCDYHNDHSLKELLAHEQEKHGTSNMSTMQGYLHLMRRGLNDNTVEARVCRDQAFKRLVDNVWNSEYRNRLLYHVIPRMLPHEARMWRDLCPILCQNRPAGQPEATVILAQDFLTHLRPSPGDHPAWPPTYHGLRARYAEGSI